MQLSFLIEPNGDVRCLYDEAVDLHTLGRVSIQRGSHVEAVRDGSWFADLSPLAGPALGPFSRRSAALAAERQWLEDHWLTGRCE